MRFFIVSLLALQLAACASTSQTKAKVDSVRIRLKGTPGQSTEIRLHSNSFVKSYSEGQILRDRQESVDFTVLTSYRASDAQNQTLDYTMRTISKDGIVELHELGYPEKFEEIQYRVRSDGEVLKADPYPPQSLFFVPQLPIPKEEVRIGDTWVMEHAWLSSSDNLPLKLDVVGILKDIVSCGGQVCADIEVSGSVKTPAAEATGARFDGRLWGRVLFSVDRGEIVWSEMRSEEEMSIKSEKFTVLSCFVSEAKISQKYQTATACTPAVSAVEKIPKLK